MQSYTEIPGNKPVKDSRTLILNNDKTIASHYSGTAFPTTNLIVGMECYRTDLGLKYRLTSTSPVNWEPVLKAAEIAKVKVNNAVQADKATNADMAANANKLIGKNWYWSGQSGQPAWYWGGSDGTNMYVYNPANLRVASAAACTGNAVTATRATTAGTADTAKACTGNATTATKLQTARTINGVAFDGTKNITLPGSGSTVAVLMGSIGHGGTIPLPSGYTEAQCKWMVSFRYGQYGDSYSAGLRCYTDGRVVVAQLLIPDYGPQNMSANYIIIGVK